MAFGTLWFTVGIPFVVGHVSIAQFALLFCVALPSGVYAFYTALAATPGGHLAWSITIIVPLASDCVTVAAVFPEPFRASWLAGVIGFHLVAAVLLRQWAALRWRIDWLRVRPVRDPRARAGT